MEIVRGIPEAAVQALQSKLQALGYNPLPEQVLAGRMQFESASGEGLEVVLKALDLDKARSVSLNQCEFDYKLRPDLWIFLVLTMADMEPMFYLVPSMVFTTPDNVFVVNNLPPAMHHFSTWEIKVFTRGIAELSIYSLDNIHTLRTGLDA